MDEPEFFVSLGHSEPIPAEDVLMRSHRLLPERGVFVFLRLEKKKQFLSKKK